MILKLLFVNLIIVLTSLECTNLERTYENEQNVASIIKQNINSTSEQPLDFSSRKNEIEETLALKSSHDFRSIVYNLTNNNIKGQLISHLNNLLITTLRVLDVIFYIYEGKHVNINHCSTMETQEIIEQINGFVNHLHLSVGIAPNRNLYLESAFARYLVSFKHQIFVEENIIEQFYINLCNELRNADIQTMFNTLLFAVRESGSTGPIGVLTCVLLVLPTFKTDTISQKHYLNFLIYLIVAHKCIVLEKSKADSDLKLTNIQKINKKIYRKMCMILFPETYRAKLDQIYNLTRTVYRQNHWFNEFSVILVMHFFNGLYLSEQDFIYRSLNDYEFTGHKKINDSLEVYYKYMLDLFYIEKLLLDKTMTAFVSYQYN